MQLTLSHVTHTYQPGSPFESAALTDVSLTIGEGEFLALIGHTGSGKSTLAQHLNGLMKPTSGQVLLDGQDINAREYDRRALRQQVGLVFQYPEYQLFEETVAKDVAFGPRNLGLSPAEIDERVREAIEKVGLDYAAIGEKSPFELSGGQMRRVAIAGVLAMRPRVLVLDEPTAGLDPLSRGELLETIKALHLNGSTIVMISHNMDDVARYATRIVVMEKGAVRLQGAPRDVFSQGELLLSMGLDVPQPCQLGLKLRSMGIDFPDCYLLPETLDALIKLLGGDGHAR